MSLLVFGRTGQLARELAARAPEARYLDRDAVDLTDTEAVVAAIRDTAPAAIINAAAYTAVDKAEDDPETAQAVNAAAPGAMAREAAALGVPLLHVSTDYVFDGSGEAPWKPDAPTSPLGVYGTSKRAGEEAVRAAAGAHVILRTSWVFSAHGANFVKTMLRLAETRDALNVVEDQIGGPTAAGDIASALLSIATAFGAGKGVTGSYHFAGVPATSWADFAREIFAQAGRDVTVTGIPSTDYPTPAARPKNSRLDGATLMRDYAIAQPDWRKSLKTVLAAL